MFYHKCSIDSLFKLILIMKLLRNAIILCTRNRITSIPNSKCHIRNLSAITELTRIRYPDVKRGNFSQIENEDLLAFSEILDKNRVITEESDLEGMHFDTLINNEGSPKK